MLECPLVHPLQRMPSDLRSLPPIAAHHSLSVLVLALAALWGADVSAMGIGRPATQSALGQSLNLLFPLQLAPGESIAPECLRAEVLSGETKLPGNLLQLQLVGRTEGEVSAIRLRSAVAIDEPVVTVTLNIGCPQRFTRQFTAFVDPPDLRQPERNTEPEVDRSLYSPALRAAMGSAGANPADLLERPAAASEPASSPAQLAAAPGVALTAASAASARQKPAARAAQGSRADAGSDNGKSTRHAGRRKPAVAASAVAQAAPAAVAAAASGASAVATGRPRLQLEPAEALAAASAPVSAASGVPGGASADTQGSVEALQRQVRGLQAQGQEMQSRLLALSKELENSRQASASPVLLIGLLSVCVCLLGACAWLARQLHLLRRSRPTSWWNEERQDGAPPVPPSRKPAVAAPTAQGGAHELNWTAADAWGAAPRRVPHPAPRATPEPSPDVMPLEAAAAPAVEQETGPDLAAQLAQEQGDADPSTFLHSELMGGDPMTEPDVASLDPLPYSDSIGSELLDMPQANTDLQELEPSLSFEQPSVEELIDLEQQVDFFMVLGQEQAAVELLSSRLDQRGRSSALPHLKLLELLQRRGDQTGFERIAEDFSERFHARAPAWSELLGGGEGLAGCPAVMAGIQERWADSASSMLYLQSLLAQNTGIAQGFDLAAYRDILMLYAVARDRSEHEVRGEDIDVFLPLDAERQPEGAAGMMATMVWQAPPGTAATPVAVDLDLSLDDPATRP